MINLLPFQLDCAHRVHGALFHYKPFENRFEEDVPGANITRGETKPFVYQVKAVTGSGKTPLLSYLANLVRGSIVLWTTPRSAIISQTLLALQTKYRPLLAPDTDVFDLSEISDSEWEETIEKAMGVTILVSTVAAFNQEGDKLRLHRGSPSRWDQLKWMRAGGQRRRKLYVFYDEGHHGTERQFGRLLELRPDAFIMASASALTEDLLPLLPGETNDDRLRVFNSERITIVKTRDVVEAGLLKRELEIFDLDEPWQQILGRANEKRTYLHTICPQPPILCAIVKRTENGIDVWQQLVSLRVEPGKIAVHLNNASDAMRKANGGALPDGFRDTYKEGATPEDLRNAGYTHLIWNITLQEGWDEGFAFVCYIHDPERSVQEIEQKIGRFIRNPFYDSEGLPMIPEHPDLRKAYFYFNASNALFSSLLETLRENMNLDGYEVLKFRSAESDRPAREVVPLSEQTIPRLSIQVKDPVQLTEDFLSGIKPEEMRDTKAPGQARVGQLDLLSLEMTSQVTETESNVTITSGQVVRNHLELYDWRLVRSRQSTGAWLTPQMWLDPKLNVSLETGSPAYDYLANYCRRFVDSIERYIQMVTEEGSNFAFGPVKLSNPDGGDDEASKEFYKVRRFTNAVHPEYNALSPTELAIAEALDATGLLWAKNFPRSGYGIPLLKPTSRTHTIFADFVVWKKGRVTFLDLTGEGLPGPETLRTRLAPLPANMEVVLASIDADETNDLAGTAIHQVARLDAGGHPHVQNANKIAQIIELALT